jgi:NhaP-type Na+/H+ or K+/H+ antiporter
MMGGFLNLFVLSLIIGLLVGISSSILLKKLKHINLNRVQESSIIILFAFISYLLSETLNLSPIISLLFTGITMSQYTFFNLSFQARDESSIVSKIMSNIAEAFVFTYLGLTVIYYITNSFSISFIFIELIIVTFGRFCSTVGLTFLITYF